MLDTRVYAQFSRAKTDTLNEVGWASRAPFRFSHPRWLRRAALLIAENRPCAPAGAPVLDVEYTQR